MNAQEQAAWFIQHPAALGRAVGFVDLKDDLHGVWMKKMLTSEADLTLQAHRNSYKTSCLCEVIALLMMWHAKKNILFMRKTDGDVAEVIRNVERILSTEVFRQIYTALTGGRLKIVKSSNAEITLSNYKAPRGVAQLLGIGMGGSLTGKHADIIITDDIVNLKDRVSRAERERTKAIYQELQNIRSKGGRIINTGTPWHREDAFSLMPEPMKYDVYSTGIFPQENIESLRRSMSPSLFAANYELRHIASENALFEKAPAFTKDAELLRDGISHIDAAYGGEDYTTFTCGKRIGDKLYLYGRLWHAHVDTVLDSIIAQCEKLKCAPILCESNADKGFLVKEIMRKGYKARSYAEKENKYIKISSYLRKWWPNIVWLEGTDKAYLDQIMDYTEDAEHDDAPDSASVVARYYDRRSGEEYKSLFG